MIAHFILRLQASVIMSKIPILKKHKEKLKRQIAEETTDKQIRGLKRKPPIPRFSQFPLFVSRPNMLKSHEPIGGWNNDSLISSDTESHFR
jgi:hypothetical protein